MDTFFGLPSHPLLVHAVTVLFPLAALGGIVIAISPSWREKIGWITVGLAGVGLVFTWLAKESGEALEEALANEGALVAKGTYQSPPLEVATHKGAAAGLSPEPALLARAIPLVRERMKRLDDCVDLLRFLFTDDIAPNEKAVALISGAGEGYLAAAAAVPAFLLMVLVTPWREEQALGAYRGTEAAD